LEIIANYTSQLSSEQQDLLTILSSYYQQIELDTFILPEGIQKVLSKEELSLFAYARHWNPFIAALENHIATLQLLLDKDPKLIQQQDIFGQTCLHKAAKRGHDALCVYLLEKEANPLVEDNQGKRPFDIKISSPRPSKLFTNLSPVFESSITLLISKSKLCHQKERLRQVLDHYQVKQMWIYDADYAPYDFKQTGGVVQLFMVAEFQRNFENTKLIQRQCFKLEKECKQILELSIIKLVAKNDTIDLAHTEKIDILIQQGEEQSKLCQAIKHLIAQRKLEVSCLHPTVPLKPEHFTYEQQCALMQLGYQFFAISPFGMKTGQLDMVYSLLTEGEKKVIDYAINWNMYACARNYHAATNRSRNKH
jgi:hypothetical protein